MLTGLNTDVKHDGQTYHVQTEDGGVDNPTVTTVVFRNGAIVGARRTSYRDILNATDCLPEVVRNLMKDQHKGVIQEIQSGKLALPKGPVAETASEPSPTPPGPTECSPSARQKSLDEMILEYLARRDGQGSGRAKGEQ